MLRVTDLRRLIAVFCDIGVVDFGSLVWFVACRFWFMFVMVGVVWVYALVVLVLVLIVYGFECCS